MKIDKEYIFKKLEESTLDKERIIVISGASLVVQGIINETSDIDLSCDKEYFDKLNWDTRMGAFGIEIKYNDVFEICPNLYFKENTVNINNYKFMDVYKCLEIKKELNREKDKETIKILEEHIKEKR